MQEKISRRKVVSEIAIKSTGPRRGRNKPSLTTGGAGPSKRCSVCIQSNYSKGKSVRGRKSIRWRSHTESGGISKRLGWLAGAMVAFTSLGAPPCSDVPSTHSHSRSCFPSTASGSRTSFGCAGALRQQIVRVFSFSSLQHARSLAAADPRFSSIPDVLTHARPLQHRELPTIFPFMPTQTDPTLPKALAEGKLALDPTAWLYQQD